ncbi:xanthine phosphoribosyltransferase [Enterococcus faecium]|jgi:xanthine phosphoribosyltransferase|uniref:Xanthine phosphoribosyltransferase n=4 Tax=Enterococcus faecium TaxID=1352 RepID=A0A1S9M6G5_ENTFC|nr:xanthine phosphoribosyltransferase [Enterococcus faecium DO]APV54100.1 xanthine phosphoribosyltransferase [Enterococcus faecium]EFR67191.1 xanthine phosphoribosyltransferase [Enterococcus faecium TX0133a01]EFR71054.1 xanthine phosphoribosyltransferase [Enterococcus faecium TX0133B]EFR73711.1 xanthine phosphoribosyltransferase [Enterococcus faecium TX0133A]EFR78870.1 xanthine phosphoribosyltransferase [Enterococcus faecium TX0133C]EFS06524.1 xanthine phosphoribosyltransferase [Enterococcus 
MIKWRVFFFNRNIVGFCTKAVISVLINDKGANKVKELVERIQKDGRILGEGVLKVDSFVTHQVDPVLMEQMGKRFAEVFKEQGITKVVTIEASGIAPALFAARELDVPMIFARKAKSLTMDEELLTASVYSFTKQVTSTISISRKFLSSEDKVLIIDDFLANGQAAKGLIELCQQAGAQVEGIGIVIEKSFQDGRQLLEEMGLRVVSLARIASLTNGQVEFLEEDA